MYVPKTLEEKLGIMCKVLFDFLCVAEKEYVDQAAIASGRHHRFATTFMKDFYSSNKYRCLSTISIPVITY